MTAQCKLSLCVAELADARALAGTLEGAPGLEPDAVTQFDEGPDTWRVEAYYSSPPDVAALATYLTQALGREVPSLELTPVPDLNWVAVSQAALPPVSAGRFMVYGSHDRERIPRGPNAILIDAGEAFGTAHHATTLGCLLAIDRLTRTHAFHRVLDLGCGSGVLAIAAARKRRRAQIFAADYDPQAIAVAKANARTNGVGQRIAFVCASGLAHPLLRHAAPFDLVVANILAAPLQALAPDLARGVRRGGILVLSGLLNPEAGELTARYVALGFALAEHRRISGWSTLTLRKRGR